MDDKRVVPKSKGEQVRVSCGGDRALAAVATVLVRCTERVLMETAAYNAFHCETVLSTV